MGQIAPRVAAGMQASATRGTVAKDRQTYPPGCVIFEKGRVPLPELQMKQQDEEICLRPAAMQLKEDVSRTTVDRSPAKPVEVWMIFAIYAASLLFGARAAINLLN